MKMERYLVDYCLRFNRYDEFQNVSFGANLTRAEIDSLAFLFSVYFDQQNLVQVKGLTFFTEFNKCVEFIKRNFEQKQDQSEVKRIFSLFLKDEFMSQVPNFQIIMKYLKRYYKPIPKPDIVEKVTVGCENCSSIVACFNCKCRYLSESITTFDSGIQDGWDIFLRPMFGLPLYLTILLNTTFEKEEIFKADDLITNSFAQFFYNLLCDKASTNYMNWKARESLVLECRKVTVGIENRELEMLLAALNSHSYHTKLFAPFKRFMEELNRVTRIKKVNKIASVIFTGFYLRNYLDAAPNKTMGADELEIRNVCRLILKQYNSEQFEEFIVKLKSIKMELCVALMESYIIPESFIRQLCIKYNVDKDIEILLDSTNKE
uniref:p45 n=1 Tax=Spodoptera littoralis nuclear polyhedrosis virus TaxID=10456 RepID=A0A3G4S965_NPVSL|nr:p45 [Spodoptera littoralis nucleopolyhedrovirus]